MWGETERERRTEHRNQKMSGGRRVLTFWVEGTADHSLRAVRLQQALVAVGGLWIWYSYHFLFSHLLSLGLLSAWDTPCNSTKLRSLRGRARLEKAVESVTKLKTLFICLLVYFLRFLLYLSCPSLIGKKSRYWFRERNLHKIKIFALGRVFLVL